MAKPGMYNYVGVGGLQGHTALRIVFCFCKLNDQSSYYTDLKGIYNKPLKNMASFVFQDEFLQR